jgi:hypothetical protein
MINLPATQILEWHYDGEFFGCPEDFRACLAAYWNTTESFYLYGVRRILELMQLAGFGERHGGCEPAR